MLLEEIKRWRHVFKLDPNRILSDLALKHVCLSGTDAIIIGGTDGVTFENTNDLLERVQEYEIKCVQEVSNMDAIVPGMDGYLIPTVLNTEQAQWIMGAHHEAVKLYGDFIPWDRVVLEGYLTLNPQAKVSRVTQANTDLDVEDCIAYGRMTDRMYRIPIFYIEYSGCFGDVNIVRAVKKALQSARLFYGGGLTNETQVRQMAAFADTVVVGNLIYYNVERAVQTVVWTKTTSIT